jgi:hypothetical protein
MAKTDHARMAQPSGVSSEHSSTPAAATTNCPKPLGWSAYEVLEAASHVEGRNEVVICYSQSAANA